MTIAMVQWKIKMVINNDITPDNDGNYGNAADTFFQF